MLRLPDSRSNTVATTIRSLVFLLILSPTLALAADVGNEYLVPDTTKMFISLPDPDEARDQFNASQLGKLVNHEKMAKFIDALEEQYKDSGRLAERLGISPRDLDGVYDGDTSLAVIQPGGDHDAFATALVMKIRKGDPTGAAGRMLGNIVKRRLEQYKGSRTAFVDFDPKREKEVYRITTPKDGKRPPIETYYFFDTSGNYFVAVDHEDEAKALYKRIPLVVDKGKAAGTDSLGSIDPFKVCMERVAAAWKESDPQVRWFLDPFNYMRVTRAEGIATGVREKRRGRDMIDVYAEEGFDAIQGAGGWINFSEGDHEVLHRSFVYAPAVNRGAKDPIVAGRIKIEEKLRATPKGIKYDGPENKKYLLGARMLHFFSDGKLPPLDWVPDDIATHTAFNWYLQRAFKYSETLVNAYSDDVKHQEVWWGTLDSIRDDKDGPMVDIRKDMVMHLGTRATYLTDYVKPIDVDSEQSALAMEITGDAKVVAKAIDKQMEVDPDAKKHEVGGITVWEVIPPDDVEDRPVSWMVAYGHLFRASHAGILKKLAAMPAKQLAKADDLKAVNVELDKLSDDKESFRYFDRLDRSMEQNWELIRAGKFPQSDSMLANMVARGQGYDPRDPETKERKQEIDGTTLPPFEFAKPFLGPNGMFVKGVDDGWLVTGTVLTK